MTEQKTTRKVLRLEWVWVFQMVASTGAIIVAVFILDRYFSELTSSYDQVESLSQKAAALEADLLISYLPAQQFVQEVQLLTAEFALELEQLANDPSHSQDALKATTLKLTALNQWLGKRDESSRKHLPTSIQESMRLVEDVGKKARSAAGSAEFDGVLRVAGPIFQDLTVHAGAANDMLSQEMALLRIRQLEYDQQISGMADAGKRKTRELARYEVLVFLVLGVLVALTQLGFFHVLRRRISVLEEYAFAISDRRYPPAPFTSEDRLGRLADDIEHVAIKQQSLYVELESRMTEAGEAQAEAEQLAYYDPLTGLGNRRLFHKELTNALNAFKRHRRPVSLFYLDLDGFKRVNDSMGHDAGDALLKMVAQRLGKSIRDEDFVARLGGDEFAVVSCSTERECVRLSERILTALNTPFQLADGMADISTSIGISVPVDGEEEPSDLMRNADMALYKSKHAGRNQFHFFREEFDLEAQRLTHIRRELSEAIENDQLTLVFQPKVSLDDRRVDGLEALLRWVSNEGPVSPANFIPVAEETGLILPLGEWVMRQSCMAAAQMAAAGKPTCVAVNVSGRQLYNYDLKGLVEKTLKATGLPARYLELEVTESMVLQDADEALRLLEEVAALGVKISIDDFGTGFSSMDYIRRFPAKIIKIDQVFIRSMLTNEKDRIIVDVTIGLATRLGMDVVAEGVEEDEQVEQLRAMGCRRGQGYLFCRPAPLAYFLNEMPAESFHVL